MYFVYIYTYIYIYSIHRCIYTYIYMHMFMVILNITLSIPPIVYRTGYDHLSLPPRNDEKRNAFASKSILGVPAWQDVPDVSFDRR